MYMIYLFIFRLLFSTPFSLHSPHPLLATTQTWEKMTFSCWHQVAAVRTAAVITATEFEAWFGFGHVWACVVWLFSFSKKYIYSGNQWLAVTFGGWWETASSRGRFTHEPSGAAKNSIQLAACKDYTLNKFNINTHTHTRARRKLNV